MLQALTLILICQLAGELVVRVAGLPVPGPVLGMLLLLGWLFLRDGISPEMERTTTALLDHLSLLFVPAGVGVIVYWEAILQDWWALTVALVVSTLVGLAATALTMRGVQRLMGGTRSSGDDG